MAKECRRMALWTKRETMQVCIGIVRENSTRDPGHYEGQGKAPPGGQWVWARWEHVYVKWTLLRSRKSSKIHPKTSQNLPKTTQN